MEWALEAVAVVAAVALETFSVRLQVLHTHSHWQQTWIACTRALEEAQACRNRRNTL